MTRFPFPRLRGLVLAVVVLAATSAHADADSRLRVFGYARAMPVETVPDSIIDDWKYLDDRNAMVFRRGQAYLLVLGSTCPALQSAGVIGFNAANSGLVAAKTLTVGGRGAATECSVEQIVQLERVAFGSGPAAAAPARAPRPAPPAAPAREPEPAAERTPAPASAVEPPPVPAAPAPAMEAAPEPSTPPPPPPPLVDRPIATPPGATPL